MYQSLDVFRTSGAMASHAAARQVIVAANIANADTPGYRARAIAGFAESYRTEAGDMRATRPGHLTNGAASDAARAEFTRAEPAPNGNSVSLESEMLAAVEIQREHSRALAIYRHALGVIRTSLGRQS